MDEKKLNGISLRNVNPGDIPILEKWYSMTDELGYATGFKNFADVRDRILSDPLVSRMIATGDGRNAGFVCYELRSVGSMKAAWIHIIIVDPAFQNRGIGTRAMGKLLASLEAEGVAAALVSVSERNTRGIRFWKSLGFQRSRPLEKTLSHLGTSGVAIMKRVLSGSN